MIDVRKLISIQEMFKLLTVELPMQNFKERVIQKRSDSFLCDSPMRFHIVGYIAGFKLDY